MSKSNGKSSGKEQKPEVKAVQNVTVQEVDDPVLEKRRIDRELNHAAIMRAYMELLHLNKRPPTQVEVARHCHLSRNAVGRHISEMKLIDVLPDIKWRTHTVLYGLTKKAEEGHRPEVELYLQLVHGWFPELAGRMARRYESPKQELKQRLLRLLENGVKAE